MRSALGDTRQVAEQLREQDLGAAVSPAVPRAAGCPAFTLPDTPTTAAGFLLVKIKLKSALSCLVAAQWTLNATTLRGKFAS